ncbi:MAG: hypothetical protein R6U13_01510 [Desulfatiglandaceae bacterium]
MPVNAEKEISKLWRNLHAAQGEIIRMYYRMREVALAVAPSGTDPMEVGLKAAEMLGKDMGKNLIPRLNWLKGEEGFLMQLGGALAGLWNTEGGIAGVEQGEKPGEVFIRCTRCPWPGTAKDFEVSMEEVALSRERMFQAMLEDISVFFNIPLKLEMLKAIPRGHGSYLMRLSKAA